MSDSADQNEIVVIKDNIKEISTEISETPKEDKDETWRNNLTLTLTTITEKLEAMTPTQGQDPEMTRLSSQVDKMLARLETMQAPSPPAPSVEVASPTPETQTETLSAQTVRAPKPKLPESPQAKPRKSWV